MRCYRKILTLLMLAIMLCTAGCPRKNLHRKKAGVSRSSRPERGPHGGPIAFWGNEHLLEVCIDRMAKEAKVYVLKDNVNVPQPIEASSITMQLTNLDPPVEITLKPAPLEEDPKGSSSCFAAVNPAFGSGEAIYGTVAGKVGDSDYIGEFDERARSPVPVKGKNK